jgi:hypothetical protein
VTTYQLVSSSPHCWRIVIRMSDDPFDHLETLLDSFKRMETAVSGMQRMRDYVSDERDRARLDSLIADAESKIADITRKVIQ